MANRPGLLELGSFPEYKKSRKKKKNQEIPREHWLPYYVQYCTLWKSPFFFFFTTQLIFFKAHFKAIILAVYNLQWILKWHLWKWKLQVFLVFIPQYPRKAFLFFLWKSKTIAVVMTQASMESFQCKNFCKLLFQNSNTVTKHRQVLPMGLPSRPIQHS